MSKRTYRELTPLELEALLAFAYEYGRKWKATLNEVYWYNAMLWQPFHHKTEHKDLYGSLLHGLRNSHGPNWLAGFRLPK